MSKTYLLARHQTLSKCPHQKPPVEAPPPPQGRAWEPPTAQAQVLPPQGRARGLEQGLAQVQAQAQGLAPQQLALGRYVAQAVPLQVQHV